MTVLASRLPGLWLSPREPPVFRRLVMTARKHSPKDVALSLTQAVVAASPASLLLMDGQLNIIHASASFGEVFAGDPADMVGQPLYELEAGAWDTPILRALMSAIVAGDESGEPCEIDLKRPRQPTRRLIVEGHRLTYLDLDETRILVAVSDVTEARADAALKASILNHNSVLLQEVRHRVGNSLQIIAAVLLKNARNTDSDETRGHLKDAHQRVMSVAALERLLSTSDAGDVEVHAYFTTLCEGIAASMIGELDQISLTVEGGDGVVESRFSMSLGLIVTELVINALKYAFPNGRPGKITVDYDFHGPNWVLCVRDDGVGMPPADDVVRTGLGTSIVQALAKQLNASVEIVPERPGTKVCISHTQIALVHDEPEAATQLTAEARPATRAVSKERQEERS